MLEKYPDEISGIRMIHRRDLIINNTRNVLVHHSNISGHNSDMKNASLEIKEHNLSQRKSIESSLIHVTHSQR